MQIQTLFHPNDVRKRRFKRCFAQTTSANADSNAVSLKRRPQMQIQTLFRPNDVHKRRFKRCFVQTTSVNVDSNVVSLKRRPQTKNAPIVFLKQRKQIRRLRLGTSFQVNKLFSFQLFEEQGDPHR